MPSFLPTFWLSDHDQSHPEDGIHCELVSSPHISAARTVLKLLAKGIPL